MLGAKEFTLVHNSESCYEVLIVKTKSCCWKIVMKNWHIINIWKADYVNNWETCQWMISVVEMWCEMTAQSPVVGAR